MVARGPSKCRRIIGVVAAIWLWDTGPAWASASGGGAGSNPAALQSALNKVCAAVHMTSCPQLIPDVTELIVEISELTNLSPDIVRYVNHINPAIAVNAENPPPLPSPVLSTSVLRPIGYISPMNGQGEAAPTQLYDPKATIFFSAGTTLGDDGQPAVVHLTYEFLPQSQQTFQNGDNVVAILLPLAVLESDGTERSVPTTVQIGAACTGDPRCLKADAVGDFTGRGTPQKHSAAELGLNVALTFGPSPISTDPHAILELQVPLIVTSANNPAYFNNPLSPAIPTAFFEDGLGFTPRFLGRPVGFAPDAAEIGAQFSSGAQTGANPITVATVVGLDTAGATLASVRLP